MTDFGRPGVYISERLLPAPIATTGTANAAGAVVGAFAQGPETVTLVTSWYDFVKQFGGYNASYPATFGVGQFFQNGGSELYVRRILSSNAVAATATIAPASGEISVGTVTAKNKGADGSNIRIQLTSTAGGRFTLSVYKEGGASSLDTEASNDVLVERFTNLTLSDSLSSDFIGTVVGLNSQYVNVTITAGNTAPTANVIPLTGGSNGAAVVAGDFTDALEDFTAIDRPLVLFAPEVTNVDYLGEAGAKTVHDALITWAAANDGFAVIDTDKNKTVAGAIQYATSLAPKSSHAAVYYPAVYVSDPLSSNSTALRKVGVAGSIAGLYIYNDRQYGPYKAPAGIGANIRGAVAVEKAFTSTELDQLNSGTVGDVIGSPVNAIRNLPGAGIVAMGARSIANISSPDRYVNRRRSLIYIKKALKDLTTFALFENNDEKLWSQLRTSVAVFLTNYLNQGGLRGTTPSQAFYVKCDAENNNDVSITNGEVHIEVGVALQYPAEFVVINLSQKTA